MAHLTVNQNQLNAAAHRAFSNVNLTFADERGVEWRSDSLIQTGFQKPRQVFKKPDMLNTKC
jgi:hypothetical protein